MPFQYEVIEEALYAKELGTYIGYGIAAFEITGESKKLLLKASDAFLEKETAEQFANLCTEQAVEPIHFFEILEDFLP